MSIATKSIWELWEKLAIKRKRINLQLENGSLENPIGLLESILVKSCGIEYKHTLCIIKPIMIKE